MFKSGAEREWFVGVCFILEEAVGEGVCWGP